MKKGKGRKRWKGEIGEKVKFNCVFASLREIERAEDGEKYLNIIFSPSHLLTLSLSHFFFGTGSCPCPPHG